MCKNVRFIERDFLFKKMQKENQYMTLKQMDQVLDGIPGLDDLTFKFDDNSGQVTIIDNNSDTKLSPRDLTGFAYDFYVRQRINMIKSKLNQSIAV